MAAFARYLLAIGVRDALRQVDVAALAQRFAPSVEARGDWASRYARAYARLTGARPWLILRHGDRGRAVERLQTLLTDITGTRVRADGEFGAGTLAAVVEAQRRAGLEPDGIADARLWRALRAERSGPIISKPLTARLIERAGSAVAVLVLAALGAVVTGEEAGLGAAALVAPTLQAIPPLAYYAAALALLALVSAPLWRRGD